MLIVLVFVSNLGCAEQLVKDGQYGFMANGFIIDLIHTIHISKSQFQATMIQRFFHLVGQGAYYLERHRSQDINIVYDCGTIWSRIKSGEKVGRESFGKGGVIHILFISHFDYEHVSLIDTLKDTVKIERVVMPLLHDEEKIFLSNIYRFLGYPHLAMLVSNPREYFGPETQIIFVRPGIDEYIAEREPLDVSEVDQVYREVPSGTPLTINRIFNWVYIPYNHQYQSRNKEFLDKLQEQGIKIHGLKTNQDYDLDAEVRKKVKAIYKRISGNINQNSMFLYSGPLSSKESSGYFMRREYCRSAICCWNLDYYVRHFDSDRVACLYTGDGDLNLVDIRAIYKNYWELIGTLQFPHHGSLPSFDASVFDDMHFFCPISVGKRNNYGHPSQKVISDILS